MREFRAHPRFWFVVFLLFVLASRVPLLGNGFGSDPDAWRYAAAATRYHETGHYTPSRNPGFPVCEGAVASLITFGSAATNSLSAIAGLVAVIIFFDLASFLAVPRPFLLTFLFAFSGPLWVHSTQTMDYALGLAFLLGCYRAILRRWYVLGGVLLALATGCRATAGALVLPALILLILRKENARAMLAFIVSFGLTVVALFVPVFLSQRDHPSAARFLAHVAKAHVTWPALLNVTRSSAVFLFSKLGALTLMVGLALYSVSWLRRRVGSSLRVPMGNERSRKGSATSDIRRPPGVSESAAWVFEIGVVVVVAAFFFMIPYDTGYLIPLLPFALLLVGRLISRPLLLVSALLVCSDSLVMPAFDKHRLIPGRLFVEIDQRRTDLEATEALLDRSPAEPTVFVIGRVYVVNRIRQSPPKINRHFPSTLPV